MSYPKSKRITCEKCGIPLWNSSPIPICGSCLLIDAFKTAPRRISPALDEDDLHPSPEIMRELFPELEIIELLAAGGIGVVYKARERKLDRFVAVKILSTTLAKKPGFVSLFQSEARAIARHDLHNIVTIYDFGDRDGFYYFVMEFDDGGEFQAETVREVFRQFCAPIPRTPNVLNTRSTPSLPKSTP